MAMVMVFSATFNNISVIELEKIHSSTYKINLHCLGMSTLLVRALETGRKGVFLEHFSPVSKRVQINFIRTDNVRILYLSCNAKSKTTVRLSKKSRKEPCFNRLHVSSNTSVILPYLGSRST